VVTKPMSALQGRDLPAGRTGAGLDEPKAATLLVRRTLGIARDDDALVTGFP